MKTDINCNFSIKRNKDAKRWEFKSKDPITNSYTVSFNEADNLDDAKISVYKALKIEKEIKPLSNK